MAIYRTVQLSFWTDNKVEDDFTPEDKYFYLYLLTNPHTNLAGCYEVSYKQMSNELGYSKDAVERLIERFEKFHNIIRFCKETKEILILNWGKHNWTKSPKFQNALQAEFTTIKCQQFKEFLEGQLFGTDTVPIPYPYPMDTSVTVTDTVYVTDADNVTVKKKPKKTPAVYYPTDELLNQAFTDFVEMRKQLKKPMTERAVQLAIKKLETLSGGDNDKAVKIIEQSIEGSWTGLYELKEHGRSNNAGGNTENNRPNKIYTDEWCDHIYD